MYRKVGLKSVEYTYIGDEFKKALPFELSYSFNQYLNFKIYLDLNLNLKFIIIDQCKWYKPNLNSDEKPIARSQHIALFNKDTNGKVWVFGGHCDPKTRLNDTWFYDVKEQQWECLADG